jgi:hypothetical protein
LGMNTNAIYFDHRFEAQSCFEIPLLGMNEVYTSPPPKRHAQEKDIPEGYISQVLTDVCVCNADE